MLRSAKNNAVHDSRANVCFTRNVPGFGYRELDTAHGAFVLSPPRRRSLTPLPGQTFFMPHAGWRKHGSHCRFDDEPIACEWRQAPLSGIRCGRRAGHRLGTRQCQSIAVIGGKFGLSSLRSSIVQGMPHEVSLLDAVTFVPGRARLLYG